MTWAHAATYVRLRDKTKVMCRCGKQSGWLRGQYEAKEWYVKHTGLVEKPRKGRA